MKRSGVQSCKVRFYFTEKDTPAKGKERRLFVEHWIVFILWGTLMINALAILYFSQ